MRAFSTVTNVCRLVTTVYSHVNNSTPRLCMQFDTVDFDINPLDYNGCLSNFLNIAEHIGYPAHEELIGTPFYGDKGPQKLVSGSKEAVRIPCLYLSQLLNCLKSRLSERMVLLFRPYSSERSTLGSNGASTYRSKQSINLCLRQTVKHELVQFCLRNVYPFTVQRIAYGLLIFSLHSVHPKGNTFYTLPETPCVRFYSKEK